MSTIQPRKITRDYRSEADSLRKEMRRMAAQAQKDLKKANEEISELRLQLMLKTHRDRKIEPLLVEMQRLISKTNT